MPKGKFSKWYDNGVGIVIDLDVKFDEMHVKFQKPENSIWLIPSGVRSLVIVSRAKDRKRLTITSQDKG